MTYEILGTGSSGNAVVLGGCVLIDCGLPWKKIGPVAHGLKLVLLTHIHSDHFNKSTIKRLAAERPMLRWGCGDYLVKDLLDCGVSPKRIDVLKPRFCYSFPGVAVEPVALSHDVPNMGYKLMLNNESVFYATDTGSLEGIEAPGYDYFLIEANHTVQSITERLEAKESRGEYAYERRAAACHLSKEQAMEWIAKNAGPNSQYVLLHGHEEKE